VRLSERTNMRVNLIGRAKVTGANYEMERERSG